MESNQTVIILTIRTDKPEAELGLFNGRNKLDYEVWRAHRTLAETIHSRIEGLLRRNQKELKDLEGIVCFAGPGSFTGLRIGLSVANALAYSLGIPVAARQDPQWLEQSIADILAGQDDKITKPYYGQPAKTTKPVK